MIVNWIVKLFWEPFERFCHFLPLIPIKCNVTVVAPGVTMFVLNNIVTKFLARFGGGFDYAVIYFIDDELFFDTGYSWASRTLKNKIFKSIDSGKVKYVLNSHDHEDHTGNNSLFSEHFQSAKIYSHRLAQMNVAFPPSKPWYRRFLFGPETASVVHAIPHEFTLQSKRLLQVIHTPGHTDGHICLYDPQNQILFSGDLFIAETLDTQLEEADRPQWITSLEKVLKLDVELILDGHGVVLKGNECRKALEAKLDFLCLLRQRVHQIAARGNVGQSELIKAINDTPGLVNFISLGEGWMSILTSGNFSRSNLIRGFLREYMDSKSQSN